MNKGGAPDHCLPELATDPALERAFLEALETGDKAGLRPFVATSLAALASVATRELATLQKETFVVPGKPAFDPDGNQIDLEVVNPRAAPTIETFKMLGLTATDQALTPKSAGETRRDLSVAAHLEKMRDLAARLGDEEQ